MYPPVIPIQRHVGNYQSDLNPHRWLEKKKNQFSNVFLLEICKEEFYSESTRNF